MLKITTYYVIVCMIIKTCMVLKMQDCNIKYSNYFKVRETTCLAPAFTTAWFNANDNFAGSESSYGIYGTDCNWGIPWNDLSYDKVLLSTVDIEKWAVVTKQFQTTTVQQQNSNLQEFDISYSSLSMYNISIGKYRYSESLLYTPIILMENGKYNQENLLYIEAKAQSQQSTINLVNHGGVFIMISDTENSHYKVVQNSTFNDLDIIISSSQKLIDTWSFSFQATQPQFIWTGNCIGSDSYKLPNSDQPTGNLDLLGCNQKCLQNSECEYISQQISNGNCYLLKFGCNKGSNTDYKFYQKLDIEDMTNCEMVEQIIIATDKSRLSCMSEQCDQVKIDISKAGLIQYQLQILSGPGNIKLSSLRSIRICDASSIQSSLEAIMSQSAQVDDNFKEFRIPMFPNNDTDCPITDKLVFYENDCMTPSTRFENINNKSQSLSNGYFYAKLNNDTYPQVYQFCIKVFETIEIKDMKFEIKANCSQALLIVNAQVDKIEQIYSSINNFEQVLDSSQLFSNTDQKNCPIKSVKIMYAGCHLEYTGSVLSLSQNNIIFTKRTSEGEETQIFCIQAQNQDQIINFDLIRYTQFASCSTYISINPVVMESFMTLGQDSSTLLSIRQEGKSVIRVNLLDLFIWPNNYLCSNATIEQCIGNVCHQSSNMIIFKAAKNETIEVTVKVATDGTQDQYTKKIIIEKIFKTQNPKFNVKIPIVQVKSNQSNESSTQAGNQSYTTAGDNAIQEDTKAQNSSFGSQLQSQNQSTKENEKSQSLEDLSMVQSSILTTSNPIQNQDSKLEYSNYEDRKQREIQAQMDKEFKEQGLLATQGGYVFPGIDPNAVKEALNNRKKGDFKPVLPKASIEPIDMYGICTLNFKQTIMLPKQMSQIYWDILFEVEVISHNDETVYIKKFFSQRRRALQNSIAQLEQTHPFSFTPIVTKHNSSQIQIQLLFDYPSKLQISDQASVRIRVKVPQLMRTQSTMTPLTLESFFGDMPYYQVKIPPQVLDIAAATKASQTTKSSVKVVNSFYLLTFVLALVIKASMQQFWGSIRTLQLIFVMALIQFTQTSMLVIFISIMSDFAQQDVFSGEEFYSDYFGLKETSAINMQFIIYGSDSMIMLLNSGSYFVIQSFVILIFIASKGFNRLAVSFSHRNQMRALGMMIYERAQFSHFFIISQKLLIESYFDMIIASAINLVGFTDYNLEFKEFFQGAGNILNSSLTILYVFLMPMFAIFYHVLIFKNHKNFKEKEERERFESFLESLNYNDRGSSLFKILFLYRRIISALWLVLGSERPYFQIQVLLVLTLTTICYIGAKIPYSQWKQNINECFNEVCVLVCIYLVMLLMMFQEIHMLKDISKIFIGTVTFNVIISCAQTAVELLFKIYVDHQQSKKAKKFYQQLDYQLKSQETVLSLRKTIHPQQQIMPMNLIKWHMNNAWSKQRKWLENNNLDLSQFEEEIQFQNDLIKMKEYVKINWDVKRRSQILNIEMAIEFNKFNYWQPDLCSVTEGESSSDSSSSGSTSSFSEEEKYDPKRILRIKSRKFKRRELELQNKIVSTLVIVNEEEQEEFESEAFSDDDQEQVIEVVPNAGIIEITGILLDEKQENSKNRESKMVPFKQKIKYGQVLRKKLEQKVPSKNRDPNKLLKLSQKQELIKQIESMKDSVSTETLEAFTKDFNQSIDKYNKIYEQGIQIGQQFGLKVDNE